MACHPLEIFNNNFLTIEWGIELEDHESYADSLSSGFELNFGRVIQDYIIVQFGISFIFNIWNNPINY